MSRTLRPALIVAGLLIPASASAQADTYTRITVSATEMYDGNLLAAPAASGPQADFVTRLGPAFDAGYLSRSLDVVARYGVEAERYRSHPGLSSAVARQDARLTLRYVPRPRLTLNADASYLSTRMPSELNLDSQLSAGRAPAARTAMISSLNYKLGGATGGIAEYTLGRDAIEGGITTTSHQWRAGLERRAGVRNTYRADYSGRRIGFVGVVPYTSHVITATWVHRVTPRTTLELTAGPRVSGQGVRPEVATRVRRQLARGEWSAGYSRSEVTAIGEPGPIDVQRVGLSARYRPVRRISLTATPAATRSTRGDRHVPVYSLDVESAIDASRGLTVVAWARAGRQHGTLNGPPATIPYQQVGVKLMISLPRSGAGTAGRVAP